MKFNFYASISSSAFLLTLLIIASEISAAFKEMLASMFGHHWIAKVVIVTILFIACGLAGKEQDEKIAWYGTVGSLVVIFIFYVLEFLI